MAMQRMGEGWMMQQFADDGLVEVGTRGRVDEAGRKFVVDNLAGEQSQ